MVLSCSMFMPLVIFLVSRFCGIIYLPDWGSLSDQNVCVCGDFNAVRCPEERRGTSGVFNTAWSDTFNNFIEDLTLLDLPLRGRMFMWFRGDGKSMSRIDRFLLSENWCLQWSNCSQVAMSRRLSDHCLWCLLLMMKIGDLDLCAC